MSSQTPRLGRGLGALIMQPNTATPLSTKAAPENRPEGIPVALVSPNRHQPRTDFNHDRLRELADSIRSTGVLQPIVVRPAGDGRYELIAGERRLRAAKLAGLAEIPAIVRQANDREALQLALIENLQRDDLGPLERATAYQRYLSTFGGTAEELAKLLSESRSNVANYLRLLKLRPEVAFMLGSGDLSMGQARALAGIDDPQRQLALARLAARRNLSVRQVEALVQDANRVPSESGATRVKDRHMTEVEAAISKALGVRVALRSGKKKNTGRIIIHYGSLDEFERIIGRLGGIELSD